MVTRLYEGDKNETGGTGIEVTDNKVINLILRSLNNLIKVNDNNEVYVDLQLEDGIENSDTLPIGVNVGRVIQADGRPVTGTLISGQTTSGDRVKILYGDNGNIYLDNGTGVWKTLGINTMTFYLNSTSDLATAQVIYDRQMSGNNAIISFGDETYLYGIMLPNDEGIKYEGTLINNINYMTQGNSKIYQPVLDIVTDGDGTVIQIDTYNRYFGGHLETEINYVTPYTPQYDGSPATKKYVDDKVVIDSNAPATPSAGQFRYDTTNSKLNIYDGTQRVTI